VTEVFISIGSNIDREQHIRQAVGNLRSLYQGLRLSPVYETVAVGFDGPPFYNLVAAFFADELVAMKQQLHQLELQAQRQRSALKFTSRTLDLDVLLFGDADLHQQGLDIPRHEIQRYAFVLKPLSDLAGERRYPGLDKTFSQLWQEFQLQYPDQCVGICEVPFDFL
jgi:2-amino-4-hydroxy-6-hydroxymethyldihydropteridine diphosphokinase